MRTKVTYIISNIDKAIAFEWILQRINLTEIDLSFILINSQHGYLANYLIKKNVSVYYILCKHKTNMPLAIYRCYKLLRKIKSDAVHCHLFIANLIGLTAAKLAGVKVRIYTRHHSDYHHVYFPKAVKWDKYCNTLATKIISISDCVTNILVEKENVQKNKIIKIPHGFDIESFSKPDNEKIKQLKNKYNTQDKQPVIGVISRFIELKGIQYIIPAYKKLLEKYPDALLLLFNASGDYEKEIDVLLKELPQNSFQKFLFENDITNLYHIFDVFIHVPINKQCEAFGQVYIESLACEIPSIFTLSGIASEFIVDKNNALVVPFQNSEEIYNAIIHLIYDKKLCHNLTTHGLIDVGNLFDIKIIMNSLETLYLS